MQLKQLFVGAVMTTFLLAARTAAAAPEAAPPTAPVPTFEQLDKELNKYKGKADLKGATNAHLETDGLAFHCLFDLFLTVMNNPEDPRHAETRRAWDKNYNHYKDHAGFVSGIMGKNVLPLLITTSDLYAKDFKQGSRFVAPRFKPEECLHPLQKEIVVDGKTDHVAWWHGAAVADGKGKTNAAILLEVAPDWKQRGVTREDRELFVLEAIGVEPWFKKNDSSSTAGGNAPESQKKP
jgi:hypothetical protein